MHAGAVCLALSLGACSSGPKREPAAPPIRDVVKNKRAPDEDKLPVITSEPLAPDENKALENYRKILGLSADPDTKAEARRRIADLQVQVDDLKGGDEFSEGRLNQSIRLYEKLLEDRPLDPKNDRVLYQLARARQNQGRTEDAIKILTQLTEQHPESALAGDAYFRRADMLYRQDQYPQAEQDFAQVMSFEDRTPFYEPAQYMKGWSQYRQAKYDEAIGTFFDILDRELPDVIPLDVDEAMSKVARGKGDLARDSLRVVSLSFASIGGGEAVNDRFARNGDPRFYPLIYKALGETLLDKQRFTDAAEAFMAFPQRYPKHTHAPLFQSLVIDTYTKGGFSELVIKEKERYARTYAPDAPYWEGLSPTEDVMTALRGHIDDLAKLNHAQAQAKKEAEPDKAREQFLVAAEWYKRYLSAFPNEENSAEMSYLLGDALLDGGKVAEAAEVYTATAYEFPSHEKSGEAALAAFQTYEKYAASVPKEQRADALAKAVESGVRLADTFDQHESRLPVLGQAAQDLFELKDLEQSVQVAGRVLAAGQQTPEVLRRNAWSVTADAQFELKNHAEAEKAYSEELKLIPADAPERTEVIERLSASIYRQGEAAREAGELREAVDHFLRVGQVTPNSKIRVNADYDAAASLVKLEDWEAATPVLEAFRQRYPDNALQADVDKMLALAYTSSDQAAPAAQAFERIAARQSETPEVRRDAAWEAAQLYDKAGLKDEAYRSFESYAAVYPRPLDRSMEARVRLVDLALERGDTANHRRWLEAIIRADSTAGQERSDQTRQAAAKASLALGRMAAADARGIRLTAPLQESVARKKTAMEQAIQALDQAAAYNFAETTTAASFEIARLYGNFGQALMESQRPSGLGELELEQYELLLEEQAYPFEEKSITAHEANLKRILQGRYDQWIKRSAAELLKIAPAQYQKREQRKESYETLR